jgi:hypothetical protein
MLDPQSSPMRIDNGARKCMITHTNESLMVYAISHMRSPVVNNFRTAVPRKFIFLWESGGRHRHVVKKGDRG